MKILAAVLYIAIAAGPEYPGPYDADLVRIIDGDTVVVTARIWPGIAATYSVRIDGVNTAEKRRPAPDCERAAAKLAKQFTADWLNGRKIVVTNIHLGKYAGRVLGQIADKHTDERLSDALIASGHAREYHGGKRAPWCKD